jgi:hypothetical protein
MMKQLARLKFTSFQLRVPHNWRQPHGEAKDTYDLAYTADEKNGVPVPGALFECHTSNTMHVETQRMLNSTFGNFIDGMCDAICSAWSQWQSAATITGLMINGPTVSLGKLVGPPLTPLILASAPTGGAQLMRYANVVATVIGNAWLQYTATITFPGIPLFPMYATWPAAAAPPMPSPLPAPLMGLTQVAAGLQTALLKQQMVGQLADPQAQYHAQLFESIADGFNQCFTLWQSTTQLTNIMGGGAVPSWTPLTPAGPVVAGVGFMAPGGMV